MNAPFGNVDEKAEAQEAKARSEREIFIVKLVLLSDAVLSFVSFNDGALVGLRIIVDANATYVSLTHSTNF